MDSAVSTNSGERVLILISSTNLIEDIGITIQQLNANTIDSIKNRFISVEQSNRKKDMPSLYGAPFRIDITSLPPKPIRVEVQNSLGSGRKIPRHIQFNVDINALIKINNDDAYCLFRSLEMLRAKFQLSKWQFSRYKKDEGQQIDDVETLLKECGIKEDLNAYDIETYGDIIQQYYDRLHPGEFKIFCFSDVGSFAPFFQSNVNEFRTPLCLYFHHQHYDAIRMITTFFCKANYCFHCLMPYDKDVNHTSKCTARCKQCCVVSSGPCSDEPEFERKCDGCNKTFKNSTCFDKHLENGACQWSKECDKCGIIYRIREGRNNRKSKKDHYCHWKMCK